MGEYDEEFTADSYSTEAKANIRARVMRMKRLIAHIEKNGHTIPKKKLIALYCIKEGISKSTVYGYLDEYIDAEIVVPYGDKILLIDQYIAMRSGDTERLKELAGSE